jgi:hypothetical protein
MYYGPQFAFRLAHTLYNILDTWLQAYYRFVILFSFHFCKVRKSELCTTWDMCGTWILEHVFKHM